MLAQLQAIAPETAPVEPPLPEPQVQGGLSEEEAATKIQAIQRGKKDRQAVKENANLLKDKDRLRAEIEDLQASINTNGSSRFSLSEVGE